MGQAGQIGGMSKQRKLSPLVYRCDYLIVFVPKYSCRVLTGAIEEMGIAASGHQSPGKLAGGGGLETGGAAGPFPQRRGGSEERALFHPIRNDCTMLLEATDEATFNDPHRFPTGILHVLVNGVAVVEGAAHTGRRPGSVV